LSYLIIDNMRNKLNLISHEIITINCIIKGNDIKLLIALHMSDYNGHMEIFEAYCHSKHNLL